MSGAKCLLMEDPSHLIPPKQGAGVTLVSDFNG